MGVTVPVKRFRGGNLRMVSLSRAARVRGSWAGLYVCACDFWGGECSVSALEAVGSCSISIRERPSLFFSWQLVCRAVLTIFLSSSFASLASISINFVSDLCTLLSLLSIALLFRLHFSFSATYIHL